MSRRALSEAELALARNFNKNVLNSDRISFACGGVIASSLIKAENLELFYRDVNDKGVKRRNPDGQLVAKFPLDEATALAIYDAGSPSPFGRGQETVFDEGYRQAHEIKPPNFALTDGLVGTSGVLSTITETLGGTMKLRSSLSKLNAYTKGSFFKPHRDTPRGESHIGTLMFCLPSPFVGGDLVVRHNGHQVVFDWANQVMTKENQIAWGFLYSDVEHEVLPVTGGTRITLAYDVFRLETPDLAPSVNARPIVYGLKDLIKPSSKFLPEGGTVVIGCQHGYPSNGTTDFIKRLADHLKGVDAAALDALKSLGLNWSIIAVYPFDHRYFDDSEDDSDSDSLLSKDWTCCTELVSSNFECGEYDGQWDQGGWNLVREQGGVMRKDFVWLQETTQSGYANNFVSYGNEATTGTIYVGAAMAFVLPKIDNRVGPGFD